MPDCIYRAVSHPPKRRWTWTIPTIIVGGAIVGGLWAGHHQPAPVTRPSPRDKDRERQPENMRAGVKSLYCANRNQRYLLEAGVLAVNARLAQFYSR